MSNFASIGYAFNCGAYVTLPVLEREYNLKYALNVMGCRVLPYWLGTFAFDYLVYLITVSIFYIVAASGNIEFILNCFGNSLVLFLLFGMA